MKKERISQIISQIDDKYINEATMFVVNGDHGKKEDDAAAKSYKRRRRRITWIAVAAALALFLAVGLTVSAISAEAKEYKEAVTFFEENGLSIEGLTRSEVKEVYRDITTKRFSYEKTAEVIRKVMQGWEIEQMEPTPEELAVLWDINLLKQTGSREGINYEWDEECDPETGYPERGVLKCYENKQLLWVTGFTDFSVYNCSYTKGGTAVWGSQMTHSPEEAGNESIAWIAVVDNDGNIVWQKPLDHGFRVEYVSEIQRTEDGTWAVFAMGDREYLCLSRFDDQGNEIGFQKTKVGIRQIFDVMCLEDKYILQLVQRDPEFKSFLCMMDHEGKVLGIVTYEDDECDYHITDMIEYCGKLYLSTYSVQKQKDQSRNHEISDVLDYVFQKDDWEISSEELTPLVRENYNAVLLMCDPDGGVPDTFYSVKGSLGGKLTMNDAGQLEWDVESITSTFFSPATNLFTVGGSCNVFRYIFDTKGALIGQIDTGETSVYYR